MPGNSYADRVSQMFQQQFGRQASADDPQYAEFVKTALPNTITVDQDALRKTQGRWKAADRLATMLAVAVPSAGVFSGLSAGTGAAGAATGTGGTTAATAGATTAAKAGLASRLGSIFSNPGFEVGTNAALSLLGQKSQNKANDQARQDTLANQAKLIELEQQRLAQEATNANLDREDAKALNAAIQDLEKKKFAIQQEQAQFERGVYESEQARLAPYRNVSQQALQRLSSMWGLS